MAVPSARATGPPRPPRLPRRRAVRARAGRAGLRAHPPAERGLGRAQVLVPAVGGLALFAALHRRTRRARRTRCCRWGCSARRNFSVGNLETLAMYGGLSAVIFFLVLFLQQVAGYDALQAGLATLPITVVMFLLSRRAGRDGRPLRPALVHGGGPLVAAAGPRDAAARRRPRGLRRPICCPALLLFALGLSATVAPLTATVLADADESNAGIASGVNNAIARVAGLLAVAALGAVVAGQFGAPIDERLAGQQLSPDGAARSSARPSSARWRAPTPDGLPAGRGARRGAGRRGRLGRAPSIAASASRRRSWRSAACSASPGSATRAARCPCEGCPGGQLAGAPVEAGRPRRALPRSDLTRPQQERAPSANPAVARGSGPAGTLHACRARPPMLLVRCRACPAARLGAGPGPRARRRTRTRYRGDGRHRGPGGGHRARRRRAAVDPLRPRPARVPGLDGGPAGAPAAVAARQPADAGGRPHPRARDPRHRLAGGRAVRAAGALRHRLDRRGGDARDPAARAAAVADRRLQLPALRAHAGDLRRQPVRLPAAHRPPGPRLPLLQLAPPPVALRPALHPAHRGPRSALAAHRLLGVEGRAAGRRARHPRAGGLHRAPARPLPAGRGRARRAEPARPRLRHRRRAQRAAGAAVQRRRGRRWRSSAGRTGPRRGGTSARAPAPSWPRASSRRPRCSRPWSSSLAAGACPPWGVRAAPACSSSPSSGWSTAATCPRRASRTGSSGR